MVDTMIKKLQYWIAHRLPGLKYPVFCLGSLICIHSGQWADITLWNGYLVVRWRRGNRYVFYSPDGTPTRAVWMLGRYND